MAPLALNMQSYKESEIVFSSRRRHTRSLRDWSSDVCSSDLKKPCSSKYSRTMVSLTALTGRVQSSVLDRKSTRLNSSHVEISYAVFCLKKKKKKITKIFLTKKKKKKKYQ